jgi:hypothetical protein
MAFIPSNPQVGDRVRIQTDTKVSAGTYTAGHEFTGTAMLTLDCASGTGEDYVKKHFDVQTEVVER